ncbi:hypothetical protein [Myxosarcina sp. GI1(2024)]
MGIRLKHYSYKTEKSYVKKKATLIGLSATSYFIIDFIGINGESEVKALLAKAFEFLTLIIAKSLVQQGN